MRRYYKSDEGYVETLRWQPSCWINIERPDADDMDFLRKELSVPQSFIDSVADEDERPRFDREDGWQLTILRIPHHNKTDNDSYTTLTFGVLTKDEIAVTICHQKTEMIEDYISYSQRRKITVANHPDFILRLIHSSAYWYQTYLKEINNSITENATELSHSVRNEDLYKLMDLQKSLVYFNTSLQGNNILMERLDKMFADNCDPELFDDVEIELQQALNTVNVYIDILDSTMDTLASVISNNVNQIMKKMTSVSIILMLPTLIASFYGMNVAVAFGNKPMAFWGIVVFSLGLAIVIYLWLKKINWI